MMMWHAVWHATKEKVARLKGVNCYNVHVIAVHPPVDYFKRTCILQVVSRDHSRPLCIVKHIFLDLVRCGHSVRTKQYTENLNEKHALTAEISMKTISCNDSAKRSAFSAG